MKYVNQMTGGGALENMLFDETVQTQDGYSQDAEVCLAKYLEKA